MKDLDKALLLLTLPRYQKKKKLLPCFFSNDLFIGSKRYAAHFTNNSRKTSFKSSFPSTCLNDITPKTVFCKHTRTLISTLISSVYKKIIKKKPFDFSKFNYPNLLVRVQEILSFCVVILIPLLLNSRCTAWLSFIYEINICV